MLTFACLSISEFVQSSVQISEYFNFKIFGQDFDWSEGHLKYIIFKFLRFPMRSWDFSIDLILPAHYGPTVDSTSKRNEHQESSWG
jgi:hypothetical protein